jgi:hypothetical protein
MVIIREDPREFAYVTAQVAVPGAPATSVHVAPGNVKVPFGEPSVNVTVPVGVIKVPPLESVTVTVHLVLPNEVKDEGTQETVVVVALLATVNAKVFELVRWSVSPP